MEKLESKQKLIIIAVSFIVVALFGIAAFFYYSSSDSYRDNNFSPADGDIYPISISPMNSAGISRDTVIEVKWSGPLDESVADVAELSPAARGEWYVDGNTLIFQPQKLSAGTLYTVTIPKGTAVLKGYSDKTLAESVSFSFETADDNNRFNEDNISFFGERYYGFSCEDNDNNNIEIPVSDVNYSEDNPPEVQLYSCDNADEYIKAFGRLFSYPTWASLSVSDFSCDTKYFKLLDDYSRTLNGSSTETIAFSGLEPGLYMVRLSDSRHTQDIAMVISDINIDIYRDSDILYAHCTKDGQPYSGDEVYYQGMTGTTSGNGIYAWDFDDNYNDFSEYYKSWAVVCSEDNKDTVAFCDWDALFNEINGAIVSEHSQWNTGEEITAEGFLKNHYAFPVTDTARIQIIKDSDIIYQENVICENGSFEYSYESGIYVPGTYKINLIYDYQVIATDTFEVIDSSSETLNLFATGYFVDGYKNDKINYRVNLCDSTGKLLSDVDISDSYGNSVKTNNQGCADFTVTTGKVNGLSVVSQKNTFSAETDFGSACLTQEVLCTTEDYNNSDYGAEIPDDAVLTDIICESSVTVQSGENIVINATISGDVPSDVLVSLYQGTLPQNKSFVSFDESVYGCVYGTPLYNRFTYDSSEITGDFSSLDLNGSYFLRIWAFKDNHTITRYVPVEIIGTDIVCDSRFYGSDGKPGEIDFYINSETRLKYTITIDEQVYSGYGTGSISHSIPIYSTGKYTGRLDIYKNNSVIISRCFDYFVTDETNGVFDVITGDDPEAFAVFGINKDKKDSVEWLFKEISSVGNQLFSEVEYDLLSLYLENSGIEFGIANNDISLYQNDDGGFSRYPGGTSDLLLSVLLTETNLTYDRKCLVSYFKNRLASPEDSEDAALACWGLANSGLDVSDALSDIADDGDDSSRNEIYLIEAYYALGKSYEAEYIYNSLSSKLNHDGEQLYYGDKEDTDDQQISAFLLNISIKMNISDSEGLINYLVTQPLNSQTARYMLFLGIMDSLNGDDISAVTENSDCLISLKAAELPDSIDYDIIYTKNREETGLFLNNDVITVNLNYEITDNHLYLVYIKDNSSVHICKDNVCTEVSDGYWEIITMDSDCSFSFIVENEKNFRAPDIYVYDLTVEADD